LESKRLQTVHECHERVCARLPNPAHESVPTSLDRFFYLTPSIGGLPTKIIWLIASIILATLPILGIAMWLARRKTGTLGAPNRPDISCPWWVMAIVIALGVLLPTVGISILVVAILDLIYRTLRRDKTILTDETQS
jgi:hypothetical protein